MKENEYLYDLYYYYDIGDNVYATDGVTKDYTAYEGLRNMEEVRQHVKRTMRTGGLSIPSTTKGYTNCVEAYDFIPYHRITLIQYYKVKRDS